jgi:hypothetical protein
MEDIPIFDWTNGFQIMGNFSFDLLKITDALDPDGDWDVGFL